MKKVVLFSDSGNIAEVLFHSPFFHLEAVMCEKGRKNLDLITFSYIRGVNIHEVENNEELIETISQYNLDLAIMCGFGIILNYDTISNIDTYNIHPGKLPQYKGRHPTFFATINGEKSIYFTLHKVIKKIDGGEIIDEVEMEYYYWQNENDVKSFLFEAFSVLVDRLYLFLEGKIKIKENSGGKYYHPVTKTDKILDPNLSVAALLNIVRAQASLGGGIFLFKGQEYLVDKIKITKYKNDDIIEEKIVINKERPIGIKIDNEYYLKFCSLVAN